MRIILKIYNIIYSYIIEPFTVVIMISIGLVLHAKRKILKIIKNYMNSEILLTCFLLSLINRTILRFFCLKFGFDPLLVILLITILATLFKIIIMISKDEKFSFETIFTRFILTFGFTLLFSYISALLHM